MKTEYPRYPWAVFDLFLIDQFGCNIETKLEWCYTWDVPF